MDASLLIGAAVTVALGGILPWINGEVVVAGAALLTPQSGLPVLVLSCSAAQMSAKAVLYGVIRWMPERMPARARRFTSRIEAYRKRRGLLVLAVFSGSAVALPPFYLVTLACGMLRVPFALFAIVGLAGTISRYGFLAWFATGFSKSRRNFLELLRARHDDYLVNDAALADMRGRRLAGPVVAGAVVLPQRPIVHDDGYSGGTRPGCRGLV